MSATASLPGKMEVPSLVLTEAMKTVIKCAYCDLVGAYQYAVMDDAGGAANGHDWETHLATIIEMEETFEFIEPATKLPRD